MGAIQLPDIVEVAKFGGSSLADKPRRDNARDIVLGKYDGKRRQDVVVSFLGRQFYNSIKPSDTLEEIGRRGSDDIRYRSLLDDTISMLQEVTREEGLTRVIVGPHKGLRYDDFIAKELIWRYETRGQISPDAHEVMMICTGEFFQAHIKADSLAAQGVPVQLLLPETTGFNFTGSIKDAHVPNQSIDALANALGDLEIFNVMPGYYGIHLDEKGDAQTLSSWDGFPRFVLAALGRGGLRHDSSIFNCSSFALVES